MMTITIGNTTIELSGDQMINDPDAAIRSFREQLNGQEITKDTPIDISVEKNND